MELAKNFVHSKLNNTVKLLEASLISLAYNSKIVEKLFKLKAKRTNC